MTSIRRPPGVAHGPHFEKQCSMFSSYPQQPINCAVIAFLNTKIPMMNQNLVFMNRGGKKQKFKIRSTEGYLPCSRKHSQYAILFTC